MVTTGIVGTLLLWLVSLLGPNKVDVCHVTGGGHVIGVRVASVAVSAHLAHGDYLPLAFYDDADGDGFGDAYAETLACEAPDGTVDNADDCDDSADFVSPIADDACGNGIDEDCSSDDALCSVEFDGWTATSGRVQPGPTAGTLIGSFTFTRNAGNTAASRGGGACLLADLFSNDPYWSTYTCSSNADCVGAPFSSLPGGFGYCGSPDGSGEPNRCWTRPGNFCSRSGFRVPGEYHMPATLPSPASATNLTTPTTETLVPAPAQIPGVTGPVRWMVVTCMASGTNPAGCASADPTQHVYTFGPTFLSP